VLSRPANKFVSLASEASVIVSVPTLPYDGVAVAID
jgi:hypothetical protein